jgi:putative colanic acid biosynthesis UDP-glucose lipid carrier transferase
MLRHMLKPGITGLAQVEGHRGETRELAQMAARIEADLRYVRSWSLGLDLKILCLTLMRLNAPQAY